MSIKNMHYDFKQKLNRLDTNAYAGLEIPEIDRKVNEAYILYVMLVAEPRLKNQLGFETSQRSIDDIRMLVADSIRLNFSATVGALGDKTRYTLATLPTDYMYYTSTAKVKGTVGECTEQLIEATVIRHNDRNQDRDFYVSNFEWRECNIRFVQNSIKVFNTDFELDDIIIDYIKYPEYIHNAEDFETGVYNLPDGTVLSGHKDCILPEYTHKEIVDLAVLLTTGDLQMPMSTQFAANTLRIKQLVT